MSNTILTHENIFIMEPLIKELWFKLETSHQFIIYRSPYRWKILDAIDKPLVDSGTVINHGYEYIPLVHIAEMNDWMVVHDFNHFGIVQPRAIY